MGTADPASPTLDITLMDMALRSFPANDAEISLKRTGKYALEDQVVGNRVQEFWQARFPTKSPLGLEFIAQNSFLREDVRQILFSILGRPILGLIKVYSDILPSDYVFRVHNGSEEPTFCLLVLLSCPDSVICFYEGSTSEYMGVDVAVSKKWGPLATPERDMSRAGFSKETIKLQNGGLVIQDSRLQFSIIKGYAILVGFGTESEVEQWGTMDIPYTDSLKAKVEELEREGIRINWVAPTEPAK